MFLPPTLHVEQLEFDGRSERLRMWVTANGEIRSWTTRRVLDPVAHRVDFRQEVLPRPVTSMGGSWTVEPRGPERSVVVLSNDFAVDGNARADVDWVKRATSANTRAALDNLRRLAERWRRLDELVLSFEDCVHAAAPPEPVYAFLHRFGDRDDAVPGATGIDIVERAPGVQLMTVELAGPDGTTRTTESVRIGFPHAGRIVYKDVRDTEQPALLAAHTGSGRSNPTPTAPASPSRHATTPSSTRTGCAGATATARTRCARPARNCAPASPGTAPAHCAWSRSTPRPHPPAVPDRTGPAAPDRRRAARPPHTPDGRTGSKTLEA